MSLLSSLNNSHSEADPNTRSLPSLPALKPSFKCARGENDAEAVCPIIYFFLPLPLPLEVELVETTLEARDGVDELAFDLTLSRALFCSAVSDRPYS